MIDHQKSLYSKSNGVTPLLHHTNKTAAKSTVESWMNSAVHRENLLFPSMTHIGCGASILLSPQKVPMIIAVQVLQSQN